MWSSYQPELVDVIAKTKSAWHCSGDDESDKFVAVIHNDTEVKDWKVSMKLNGYCTTFKLDSGAQCNVISKKNTTKSVSAHY